MDRTDRLVDELKKLLNTNEISDAPLQQQIKAKNAPQEQGAFL